MKTRRRFLALVIVQLSLLTGCLGFLRGDEEEPGPDMAPDPAVVEVTNMHWAAVNIYAVFGGQSHRLGTLVANQRERFELPGAFDIGRDVAFVADPVGATYQYRSPTVYAEPGREIVLRLENNLSLSTLSVR